MKIVFAFALIILVSGCGLTDSGDTFRNYFQEKAAKVTTQTLDNAVWFICDAASVGSIRKRFGSSPQTAFIYHNFCLRGINPKANIINPSLMIIKP